MHMHSFLDMWWSLIKSVQTTSQASSGIYLYQSILVMEFQTFILKYTQFSFHGYWDYKDHKLIILLCSMKTVWLFTFKTRWHPFFNYCEFINFCRCQFKAMVSPSVPATCWTEYCSSRQCYDTERYLIAIPFTKCVKEISKNTLLNHCKKKCIY